MKLWSHIGRTNLNGGDFYYTRDTPVNMRNFYGHLNMGRAQLGTFYEAYHLTVL